MSLLKRTFRAVTILLAVNFLAVTGAAVYLWQSANIDGEKVAAMQEVLYPPAVTEDLTLDDVALDAPPSVVDRLETILAIDPHVAASEQPGIISDALTGRVEELDRRVRELHDLRQQVQLATQDVLTEKNALATSAEQLQAQQVEADMLASDTGFQQTLELYEGMKPRQVKDLFLALDRDVVVRYLRAMEPRTANKILREFKRPDEQQFIRGVLEDMRLPDPSDVPQNAIGNVTGNAINNDV